VIAIGTVDGGERSAGDLALQGFERELAEALCARMQADCRFLEADRAHALDQLLAGKADAALAALPHRPELAARVALSLPYAIPRHGFAIASAGPLAELPGTGKAPSFAITPQIARAAVEALRLAFEGRSIGATAGSADFDFATRHFVGGTSIRPYPSTDAALAALLDGEIVAVMAPVTELAASHQRPGFQEIRRSGPEFGEDELLGRGIAAAFRKSDTALRDRVNRAIDRLIVDGSLRKLSLRWFALDVTPQRCGCKPF
jgi:octopine/nopaline transport system substrate-binding protein